MQSLHIASGDLWAGAEVQVATLLPALNALGAPARAIVFNEGTLLDTLGERGVQTWLLPESEGVVRLIAGLRRILRQVNPEVVHAHGYKEGILSHLASLGLAAARIRTIHGVPELRVGGSRSRMFSYDVVERCLSGVLGVHGIAVSRELERIESRSRAWRSGISYVPNAVPQPLRPAAPDGAAILSVGRGPLLLYVGRLEPIKGPDVLVEAFRQVHAELPDARLHLVGEGSLRSHLDQMIGQLDLGGAVRLLGESSRIPELMAASDLVVLPSRGEGMPTVLLEALAAGTAVVATRVGAIPDVTKDGLYAALVPPEDPAALALACLALLRDPEHRAEIAARGREEVQQRFGAETCARQTLAVYDRVSAARTRLRATTR